MIRFAVLVFLRGPTTIHEGGGWTCFSTQTVQTGLFESSPVVLTLENACTPPKTGRFRNEREPRAGGGAAASDLPAGCGVDAESPWPLNSCTGCRLRSYVCMFSRRVNSLYHWSILENGKSSKVKQTKNQNTAQCALCMQNDPKPKFHFKRFCLINKNSKSPVSLVLTFNSHRSSLVS